MTQPQDPQGTTPPPPPPPQGHPVVDAVVIAYIASMLMGNPFPSVRLLSTLRGIGIGPAESVAALKLVTSMPLGLTLPMGPASRSMQRTNLLRRAQYLIAAGKRLSRSVATARSNNKPVGQALRDAIAVELGYWRQHVAAAMNRTRAASAVDDVWVEYHHGDGSSVVPGEARPPGGGAGGPGGGAGGGPGGGAGGPGGGQLDRIGSGLLGWYARMDGRTSAECRRANGANFHPARPPAIGLPGSVHPNCRCKAGAPWATRRLVGGGTTSTGPATIIAASRETGDSRVR